LSSLRSYLFLSLVLGSWTALEAHNRDSLQIDWVVARDGSGDFTTVQAAIDAVPHLRKNRTTIYIKNGIYREKLILPSTKTNVSFIGENVDSTIITYDDHAGTKNRFGEEIGTSGSSGFYVFGDGFIARNLGSVSWAHQMTDQEAERYTLRNILG
jgi:pectinesterase